MNNCTSQLGLYLSIYVVLVRRYSGIIVVLGVGKLYIFLKASKNQKIWQKLKLEVKNGYRYLVFLSIRFILNFS
jgi:hypothetical protein